MLRPLLMFIGAALFGIVSLYLGGPPLWRDAQVNKASLVPAFDLKVEEAKCTSHWWIVSDCSISYSAPQTREKKSIYFAVFGTLGGSRFQLMRTPDTYVTTDIALSKLINRIMMALFLVGAVAVSCTISFRKAVEAA